MTSKLKKILRSGDSGLLFLTIFIVNAGNYLLNLLLGRILGPADFAEAGILATAVLILSFFALGFQMTAAKYGATYLAEGKKEQLAAFMAWFRRQSVGIGLLLSFLVIYFANFLQTFLHFHSQRSFWIIALSIPVYLSMSAGRGFAQGKLQFKKLALSYLAEMTGRFLLTFAGVSLMVYFQSRYFTEAVALGFLGAFAAAYFFSQDKGGRVAANLPWKERKRIFGFMWIVGSYELSQILISHSDVVLVKHFFSNEEAGLYVALALIGRIVFFATWSVVTLLFPKVIQREKTGQPHLGLFYRSLLLVMAAGLGITLGCYLLSDWIILLLFGESFGPISHLLWLYALTTTLFACANVFAYYYLSLRQYLPVLLSVLTGLLQIVLIALYHESLAMIIYIQMALMAALFFGMTIFHLANNIKNEKVKHSVGFSFSA